MAKNIVYDHGDQLALTTTAHIGAGANPESGDPVLVGQLPGVALTDQHSDGTTTVKLNGVSDLAVSGRDATPADAAIAAGDIVYLDDAESEINADATNGVRFGYALADVASGATATVPVKIGF